LQLKEELEDESSSNKEEFGMNFLKRTLNQHEASDDQMQFYVVRSDQFALFHCNLSTI